MDEALILEWLANNSGAGSLTVVVLMIVNQLRVYFKRHTSKQQEIISRLNKIDDDIKAFKHENALQHQAMIDKIGFMEHRVTKLEEAKPQQLF